MTDIKQRIRCAIYTRKSHEEGLEQEYNSLDAQRDAGEAYIASQKHEGWTLVPDMYDDGGFTGGTLDRPALKRLIKDIELRKIDVVVVYKIDRLSRSLLDFAKLIELFSKNDVSFVSVTQQFNTKDSMGRLMLNILLSFAQFERELTGERIRDKFASSKRKGMWMGGFPPLGYDVIERKLVINEAEAKTVRHIFKRFVILKSATLLATELRAQGVRTKVLLTQDKKQRTGIPITKSYIYKMLGNPIYVGNIRHKDNVYPGQHKAIIEQELWEEARAVLQKSPRERAHNSRRQTPAILKGLACCGGCQSTMSMTSTRKKGRLYRYYTGSKHLTMACTDCPVGRVPAGELEHVVLNRIKPFLQSPEVIVQTWMAVKEHQPKITEAEVRDALMNLDTLWEQLFPAEQQRILELFLEKVDVFATRVDINLRTAGIGRVARELMNMKVAA